MVNAYARYLKLNADEITRMYLDEQYASDVASTRVDFDNTISTRRSSAHSTSQFSAVGPNPPRDKYAVARQKTLARDTYTMEEENEIRSVRAREINAARQQGNSRQNVRAARRSSVNQQYGNMYSQPTGFDLRSKLPLIGIILALLLIVFIVFNVVSCNKKQEEANTIPVTGLEESNSNTAEQVQTEPAPTSFTLEYEVTSDAGAYIEIYVDGKAQVAQDVAGGTTGSYSSSDTIKFVTSHPNNVVVKVDGEEQTLTANSSGVATLNLKFSDILAAWYEAHPEVPKPEQSASSDSAEGSTTSSSGSSSANDSSSTAASGTSSSSKTTASGTATS